MDSRCVVSDERLLPQASKTSTKVVESLEKIAGEEDLPSS